MQTFDIRFAKTAGLAALLEVPENAFRWKGGGLLRIDANGFSIGLKRGLLALSGGKRTQRIPTQNLRAVYREGDALRVEFQSGESARVVLPFWANDRDAAAQIVRLLPTDQTVEMEHSTGATHSGKPRADWRMLLPMGAAIVLVAAGSWALYQRNDVKMVAAPVPVSDPGAPEASVSMPDATAALVESAATPESTAAPAIEAATSPAISGAQPEAPATTPDFLEPPPVVLAPPGSLPLPRDYVRSADFVIPIARGTAAHEVAKRELAAFEREAAELEAGYRTQRDLLGASAITPEDFAARLNDYEMRWWDLTFRVFDNDALSAPELLDLRATMLGAARLWRGFLGVYADGLRKRDHVMMAGAFDDLARAQEMQSRARLFLR